MYVDVLLCYVIFYVGGMDGWVDGCDAVLVGGAEGGKREGR